jgi:hypothetical protein
MENTIPKKIDMLFMKFYNVNETTISCTLKNEITVQKKLSNFWKIVSQNFLKIIQMLGHGLASQESCNTFKSNEPIQEPNLLGLHGLGGS